ncbi:hypothetical protein CBR_g31498 [Chara braunii]|uniref:Uncharacterized protein n=1 Tax=Chara braunii TaxID=69332 RepID=A0A388LFH4_CHABU|nr:hypothetical protein CBR_g31498 [Chara braunii]|eukprot:GBG80942.1 hypothetical protein CBR_g31498 [Chara braunii]
MLAGVPCIALGVVVGSEKKDMFRDMAERQLKERYVSDLKASLKLAIPLLPRSEGLRCSVSRLTRSPAL